MSESNKYFYLKLKDNFFDNEDMKLLESQKNGIEYQNFYLKLCLLSLKSEGRLMFKDTIPYDLNMLSTITRHSIDTVKNAIEIFKSMKIIEILETGAIYVSDIQLLIGKSSNEAERKANYRKRIVNESGTNVPKLSGRCLPEIELDIKTEIDTKKDSDYKEIVSIYFQLYGKNIKTLNQKPLFGKAEGNIINTMLKSQDKKTIIDKLFLYFENEYWFTKDGARDLKQFTAHYNLIVNTKTQPDNEWQQG